MKILMLTPYLPFPLWSGGQIRTYNLLKNLSLKHKITLFSFIREEQEKEYVPQLKKFCHDVKVFLKRPPWSLTSLSLSAITFYPLVVCMYLNKKVKQTIATTLEQENFDLIHAETFYVMPNIPKIQTPIILVEQTIEYLVYQHYTHDAHSQPLKMLMNWDVVKIRFWEKNFWQRASRVVAMSDADRQVMQHLVPNLIVDLVPNGVDTQFFNQKKLRISKKDKTILFIGNFKWLQNREAVSMLVKKIWPKIKLELPNVKLWIVGRSPSKEIFNLASRSITISPNIKDIKEVYEKADVLLAPIYGPGGTRYKILESMATGIPVVTTSTGIEGLGVTNGCEALISDDPEGLAAHTVRVLTDASLYRYLARNGRKMVEARFNWQSITGDLDNIYKKAAYERKS